MQLADIQTSFYFERLLTEWNDPKFQSNGAKEASLNLHSVANSFNVSFILILTQLT